MSDAFLPAGERRAAPRQIVRDGVRVEIVGRGCALTLTNVGPGGFAIASDENLASVLQRQFKFSAFNEPWSVVVSAQMAYCLLRPRSRSFGLGQYVTGFTFSDPSAMDVPHLISRLTLKIG